MPYALSITESDILTALRLFLLAILPAGVEVVRGQDNRVAEPIGQDFVTMTPIMRERLETNIQGFDDTYPVVPGIQTDMAPTQVTVQLDIHGPNSADYTQIFTTVWRSQRGCYLLSAGPIQPLYHGEPHQVPYKNGEQQIEERWTVDAVMQANPVVSMPQPFFDQISVAPSPVGFVSASGVAIIDVDEAYPPS